MELENILKNYDIASLVVTNNSLVTYNTDDPPTENHIILDLNHDNLDLIFVFYPNKEQTLKLFSSLDNAEVTYYCDKKKLDRIIPLLNNSIITLSVNLKTNTRKLEYTIDNKDNLEISDMQENIREINWDKYFINQDWSTRALWLKQRVAEFRATYPNLTPSLIYTVYTDTMTDLFDPESDEANAKEPIGEYIKFHSIFKSTHEIELELPREIIGSGLLDKLTTKFFND